MRSRPVILFTALSVLTVGLFLLDLAVGAVRIPVGDVWAALTGGDCPRTTAKIVLNIRLIKAVVALLAGAALSVSGLQMQTLFRNPLAGPYVLGISSGASLGVALVVLAGVGSSIGIAGAAWLEPVESRSGYEYRNGLGYYKEVKDASTNYFFERLPKGTYVIEAECYVERAGRYALGAVKLNGVYAPEFSAYGAGTVLEVQP